ncbi:MAG: hypothetical protein ACREL1_01900 [bacterium]
MDDLIQKFFQADLTEAEEQALSDQLKNFTEEALRFGEEAEARYIRAGLPEPQLPRPLSIPAAAGGSAVSVMAWVHGGLKILVWILGIALASVVAFGLWRNFVPQTPAQNSTSPVPGMKAQVSTGLRHFVIARRDIHPVSAPSTVPTGLVPVLTPVDLNHPLGRTFSALSITVHKVSAGPVTVQVLTLDGKPLVPLYRGLLKPGNWGFEWDGKLADRSIAASGYYQIQLNSGSGPQKKIIQIQ